MAGLGSLPASPDDTMAAHERRSARGALFGNNPESRIICFAGMTE